MANYIGNLTDRLGLPVISAAVYVYAAGTNTLIYQTSTDALGSYSIPNTGVLATPGTPIDLEFAGGGIQTFKRPSIVLF